jgi:hypothetical protein
MNGPAGGCVRESRGDQGRDQVRAQDPFFMEAPTDFVLFPLRPHLRVEMWWSSGEARALLPLVPSCRMI